MAEAPSHCTHSEPARNPLKTTAEPSPNTRQQSAPLPEGACNYRDLSAGSKPPGCGCRRFWLGPTFGRIGLGRSQSIEPWCACGHHACFHDRSEKSGTRDKSFASSVGSKSSLDNERKAIAWQQETAPTQPWEHRHRVPSQVTEYAATHDRNQAPEARLSAPSGQVEIPSFHLTSSELRGHVNYHGTVGLGLDFQRGIYATRKISESPTVADAASLGDDIPSTRHPSTDDRVSPSDAFMQHLLKERRETLHLDTNSVGPAHVGLGLRDIIQSATEVATPSVSAVSNVSGAAKLIQEAAGIVKILEQGVAAAGDPTVDTEDDIAQPSTHTQAIGNATSSTIRDALRDIPAALYRLAPLLGSLQSHVARNPDLSIHESINSLVRRMDALENASFNQLPPEQVHEQFQHIDVRLSDLEARTDEHGRILASYDPGSDQSASRTTAKKIMFENASFTTHVSGQSVESVTSSALIAAAIDRVEAAERLKAAEERLDVLESVQLPCMTIPWQIEVVLLPWGRNLRGIWYSAADMKTSAVTQDDEQWTPARNARATSKASMPLEDSGWNDRTIREWASGDEDVLYPKATGVNGIVYHRLKSRGLVRNITLTGPSARDLVTTLVKSFGELLGTISHPDNYDAMDEESDEGEPMGLTAPFLPLRKIHKSSSLKFLTEAELITPTLWTAGFLASGVLMRAPSGQKRLFVTTRTGYLQGDAVGWSWAALRQLPRVHDPNSQTTIGELVPEADALEPCWKHHPAIDDAPSTHTSFRSEAEDSAYVEARALTQQSRSGTSLGGHHGPDHAANDTTFLQPITPMSEFPPGQGWQSRHCRTRTLSTAPSDAVLIDKGFTGSLPQPLRPTSEQSKRRIRSFEQTANPALIAALPTFVPAPVKGSVRSSRVKKRRRLTLSKSASSAEYASQFSGQMDAQSLHPEADPEAVLEHLQEVIPQGGEIKPLSHFWPRFRGRGTMLSSTAEDPQAAEGIERVPAAKRHVTPSAYATPFSGTVAGVGDHDEDYVPSESGEDDWGGVDGDHGSSNTDEHVIDDEMSDDESADTDSVERGEHDKVSNDELLGDNEDEDEEMSSEDELRLQA